MKAFVVGALLLQTLNAQLPDDAGLTDIATGAVVSESAAVAEPAPLLTPGVDAPAEADLLPATEPGLDNQGAAATPTDELGGAISDGSLIDPAPLPLGTADVIIEPTAPDVAAVPEDNTAIDDFVFPNQPAATTEAGLDAEFTSAFDPFPPDTTTANDSEESETVVLPDFGFEASTTDSGIAEAAVTTAVVLVSSDSTTTLGVTSSDTSSSSTSTDATITIEDLAGPTADPSMDEEVVEVTTTVDVDESQPTDDFFSAPAAEEPPPEFTDSPEGELPPMVAETSSTSATETFSLGAPDVTLGPDSGLAAGLGNYGPGWGGEDNGAYDGQDYGEDAEECPSWCYKTEGSVDYSDNDESFFSMIKRKLFGGLRRRQTGFAAFQWPDPKQSDEDVCDEDVPGWLFSSSVQSARPCKPKCPAICYTTTTSTATTTYMPYKPYKPTDTYESYKSTETYEEYKPYTSTDTYEGYKPSEPTDVYESYKPYTSTETYEGYKPYTSTETYEGYEPYTSTLTRTRRPKPYTTRRPWAPYTTVDSHAYGSNATTPYDDTDDWASAPYPSPTSDANEDTNDGGNESVSPVPSLESATLPEVFPTSEAAATTPTTFVTSTVTGQVEAMPSAPSNDADWTGDTLDTICPKTCDPFNPATNKCDVTTSCTTTGKGKYYCACRAGFRASDWNEKDFSKQFKFQGQPYVYAAQGVVCNQVCSDQTCSEVMERPLCQ